MKTEKLAWIQWLRLFAAFAVVLMHTAAYQWYDIPIDSPEWRALTYWDGLVRWPVPVFVMITGALFLPRKTELRTVWKRYIPRLAAAWLVWSGIYAAYAYGQGAPLKDALLAFASGHYHLWYLPFLCGVYLVIPFVQKIAEDPRLTKQLLALSIVFGQVIPWTADLAALLIPRAGGLAQIVKNHLHYTFFFDLLAVLLLGHVLHQTDLSRRAGKWFYTAGILGTALTLSGTIWLSGYTGNRSTIFFEHASPANLCSAAALFVFAKYHLTRLPRLVDWMAKHSFGIYLCHPLIIELLAERGSDALTLGPVWGVPVLSVAVFLVSLAVSAVIAKLPLVGRYLT